MWSNLNELFLLTDNLTGGKIQIFKRRLKFALRQILFRKELLEIFRYFEARQLLSLFSNDTWLYLKCTRSYLYSRLNGEQRVKAQLYFFDWLLNRFSVEFVKNFYNTKQVCITKIEHSEQVFEVMLSPSLGLGREGELMVALKMNGHELMKASISVLPAEMLGLEVSGQAMFIGCFQGTSNTKDLMKQATQAMERTKPSFIFFNALQACAEAWNMAAVVGVADDNHIYASYYSLSKRIGISYDDLWQELGADSKSDQGLWILPIKWRPRPENEVESKKRSALRKRNLFRADFISVCIDGVRGL
jgi:uncharacterized protein VirK/YbjX